MDKLVSIIVPVHNSTATLNRCVDSILGQTYKEIEIILVENGSSDDSYSICQEYAQKYPEKVTAVTQKQVGPSSARNSGITLARGTYIQFVDADDYIAENMTEKMVAALEKNKADLCICGYREVDGVSLDRKNSPGEFTCGRWEIMEALPHFFSEFWANSPCNKLYLAKYVKPCFEENKRMGEDLFFNLQYYPQIHRITGIEECLYFYRKDNPTSLTATASLHSIEVKKEIYVRSRKFAEVYVKDGVADCASTFMRFLFGRLVGIAKKEKPDRQEYHKILSELAEDTVIHRACKEAKLFTWKQQIFKYLLYRKQLFLLEILMMHR